MNTWTVATWLWEFVWQSTLCLCVGGALSLVWNRWPARGHRVLMLAIAACFITPVLTLQIRRMDWGLIPAESAVKASATLSVLAAPDITSVSSVDLPASVAPLSSVEVGTGGTAIPEAHTSTLQAPTPTHFDWGLWAVLGWAVLSAFALVRLLVSMGKGALVLRSAGATGETETRLALQRAVARLGLKVEPRLLVSTRVSSPVICCWGSRPAIIIPDPGPEFSRDNVWTGIFSHELAHWKRRDHYAALLGELLLCCLPWHPLAWWARRRLSQLSEFACDRWVLACGQPAEVYADSLLDLVPQHKSAFVLPALGTKKHLQGRIRGILSEHQPAASIGWAWASTAAGVALLLAGTIALAQPRSATAKAGWQISKHDSKPAASGLGLRLLVKGWASDFSGCPSVDGRYVCDLDRDQGWELCVRDRLSGKSRLLTTNSEKAGGEPFTGVISPDNKHVAYNWYRTNSEWTDELRLVRLDGSGTRLLYRSANSNNLEALQWSADGRKVLATASKDSDCQLLLISVADGSAEVLKTLPSDRSFASLSPDDRYIAFDSLQRGSTNACDVFLYDTRQKRDLPLVTHPADDRFLGWSRDGKWIVFSSDRWGTLDLWLVQVGDGKSADAPRMIKSNLGVIKPKGFTRDGSFYYSREFHACDVYTASMDLQTGRFLEAPVPLPFLDDKALPAWSHDGQSLAYLKLRKQRQSVALSTLMVYSPATGEVREFDHGELGYYDWKCDGLHWSTDDRFILAEGYDKDSKGHVYQVDVRSGQTTLVADKAADGKPLVFAPDVDSDTLKMLRDAEAVRKRAMDVNPGAAHVEISPDGQSVAFTVGWRSPKIMLIPAAGGTVRELSSEQQGLSIYQMRWTPDSRSLLYVTSDKEYVTSLWKISTQGGPARRLWITNPRLGQVAIHPDGRRLALGGSTTMQHEVWVLENFLPNN